MAEYIPKSALLAEIENLLDKGKYHDDYDCAFRDGNNSALYALTVRINTLEVKEVDLEKELIKWHKEHFKKDGTFIRMSGFYLTNSSQMDIAKHFFELGLKAQKREDI